MKSKHHTISAFINIHDVYQSRDRGCLQKFLDLIQSTNKPSVVSASINRRDSYGRTILHLISASNQQFESLDWLKIISKNYHLQVNLPDLESGWTPLHRALYHGNFILAKALIDNFECDLSIKDHEGLSAFELYMSTIGGHIPPVSTKELSFQSCSGNLFTWGSNRNFLLGIHDDGDRHYPERIHLKRFNKSDNPAEQPSGLTPFISNHVRFVAMSRLHTALITSEGELRVCGFGSGGRLGLASISKPNCNQDNLDSISAETQFTFTPVKGGGLANQRVNFVALGQDHTVVVTELGQVFTFGMNRFGQLGYPPESSASSIESMIQVEPKRVAGLLKKVKVIGAAASRWHTAVFSSDSLYTWGTNRGQLGYPFISSSPIQITPRRVSISQTSLIQLSCMNYATAYLCDNSSEIYVLKSDVIIRVVFTFDRFPYGIQVSNSPGEESSSTTRIAHIDGSDHILGAVSSMGDVYIVDLEQYTSINPPTNHISMSNSPHRSNATSICSGPAFKPRRVWTSTKWANAAKSAAVGMDGDLIVVTMSGDVHISYKRSGVVSKGLDTRPSEPFSTNLIRKNYKFQRVPYLQQVSQVAASPTGSYAAIREDIPSDQVQKTSPEENITLPTMLATMLSHIKKQATLVPETLMMPSLNLPPKASISNFFQIEHDAWYNTQNESKADEDVLDEKEEQDQLMWDARVGSALFGLSLNWIDHHLSGSLDDGDIFLVARSGQKVLVHRFILCSRSKILDQMINGLITIDGISLHLEWTGDTADKSFFTLPAISFDRHSLLTLLLLIHYLYTDHFPCLWDSRVLPQVENSHQQFLLSTNCKVGGTPASIPVLVNEAKEGLKNLATCLSLPLLEKCLMRHGKSTPKPSLSDDFRAILPGLGLGPNLTEEVDFNGNRNLQETLDDHLQISKSHNLNPDIELEMKDGEVLTCHSILMRAQCPFFRLMYDQGVWIKERRQSIESSGEKSPIRFDMAHLTKDVMQVVLQHIYTDDADNLFPQKDFHSLNQYVDFVFDVMAVANELMMDKLKFICSVVLRRCVNLLNVTAIAAEAEFYRADSLQEVCMKHMIYNLEGIFQDSKGLSNIPDDLLLSLSNYLKNFQKSQFPFSRSSQKIDELMTRHSHFLLELDLPPSKSKLTPTSHHWKPFTKSLAPPNQALIGADLFNKSSPDKKSTQGLKKISNQQLDATNFGNSDCSAPDSSAVTERIVSKPFALGHEVTDDVAPFVMDDVETEVSSALKAPGKVKLNSSSISDRPAWSNPMRKVIPLDIRTTISAEKQRSLAGPSNLNRDNLGFGSPARLPSDYSMSSQKLSQREKRRQSAEAPKSESKSAFSANQNHKSKLPAWRSISSSNRKITPGKIESSKTLPPVVNCASPLSSNSPPTLETNKRDKMRTQTTAVAACSGRLNVAKNSPEPSDPASAIGAAIITPTRGSTKITGTRQFSRRTLSGQDTPWTNYASSCSNFIGPPSSYLNELNSTSGLIIGSTTETHNHPEGRTFTKPLPLNNHQTQITTAVDSIEMRNESTTKPTNFSIIQDLQAQESWALYGPGRKMNKPNLTRIQEEENQKVLEKKQEEQFLKWFEEESQKVQKQQQQELEAEQRRLDSCSRSTKSVNKKNHIDHAAAHRGKKGNSSKKPRETRIDQQQSIDKSNTVDDLPKSNNRPSKSANNINTDASVNRQRTNQPKNKQKKPLASSGGVGEKDSMPHGITPDNTLSNLMTKPDHSNFKLNHPDHDYHQKLSGVHA